MVLQTAYGSLNTGSGPAPEELLPSRTSLSDFSLPSMPFCSGTYMSSSCITMSVDSLYELKHSIASFGVQLDRNVSKDPSLSLLLFKVFL